MDAGSWFSGESTKREPLPLLAEVADRCRQHGMSQHRNQTDDRYRAAHGNVIALAACELWEGMTPPLLSSFEIDALAAQAAVPSYAGCCWTSGAGTGVN